MHGQNKVVLKDISYVGCRQLGINRWRSYGIETTREDAVCFLFPTNWPSFSQGVNSKGSSKEEGRTASSHLAWDDLLMADGDPWSTKKAGLTVYPGWTRLMSSYWDGNCFFIIARACESAMVKSSNCCFIPTILHLFLPCNRWAVQFREKYVIGYITGCATYCFP